MQSEWKERGASQLCILLYIYTCVGIQIYFYIEILMCRERTCTGKSTHVPVGIPIVKSCTGNLFSRTIGLD